jgi:hypothetical protein
MLGRSLVLACFQASAVKYIRTALFWVVTQRVGVISVKYNQQDVTFSRSVYFYKLLYMFQAVSPPIIRSTNVHTASGIVKTILLPAAVVDGMGLRSIPSTMAAVLV